MHQHLDLVWESTTSANGTGAYTLAGSVAGFLSVAGAGIQIGDTLEYSCQQVDANGVPTGPFESGIGTYSATNTLTRTYIDRSSNANAAVSWTGVTRRITLTRLARDGALTATPTSGQLDDYAPTGFNRSVGVLRINPSAGSVVITGLSSAGFADGQQLRVMNTSTDKLVVLADQATALGTAANRIKASLPTKRGHIVLAPYDSVTLERIGTVWQVVVLNRVRQVPGAAVMWQQDDGVAASRVTQIRTQGSGAYGFVPQSSTVNVAVGNTGRWPAHTRMISMRTEAAANANVGIYRNSVSRNGMALANLSRFRWSLDQNPANLASMFIGIAGPGSLVGGSLNIGSNISDAIGFVSDSGDTGWSFLTNDYTGAPTKSSAAPSAYNREIITTNATKLYEGWIFYSGSGNGGASAVIFRVDDPSVLPVSFYASTNIPNMSVGVADLADLNFFAQVSNLTSTTTNSLLFGEFESWLEA